MDNTYQQVNLTNINEELVGKNISIYGRVHNLRNKSKFCFIVLRQNIYTIQCVAHKKTFTDDEFKKLVSLSNETVINIHGLLTKIPDNIGKIESCSYKYFELSIHKFDIVSSAKELPFPIDDANCVEENKDRNKVLLVTRLDNRYFDLRVPINYCIFKMQSGVTQLFREYLTSTDFMEIHTPKLISAASEGGAAVFPVKYFDKSAYLAQSPQLYKQMVINSDFNKVFEIGPVFRAENCQSHRHLCEFVGLDIEMTISPDKTYYEILETIWSVLDHIFTGLKTKYAKEYNYIKDNHKFEELVYSKEPLIINFTDGVKMLNDNGFEQSNMEDLSTANEKALGNIIKDKFGSDLFVLDKYPADARPFYTMPTSDGKYSNSYDVIMRGEEISSGSQRINNYDMLLSRMKDKSVDIKGLEDYVESFKTGSKPHGGFGMGLERIVMLYFNLGNVKKTSLFPRDPHRLTP